MYNMMSTLSNFGMLQSLMHVIDSASLELHRPRAHRGQVNVSKHYKICLCFHYLTGRSPRISEMLSPEAGTYRSVNELPRPSYVGVIPL